MDQSERDAYTGAREKQLVAWGDLLARLETRAASAAEEKREDLRHLADKLRGQEHRTRVRLSELKDSTSDAWEEVKFGFESAWNELEQGFSNARSHFQS